MGVSELIENMRARAEKARRLANAMNSPIARKALLEMAEEAEADIKKLQSERGDDSTQSNAH